MLLVPPGVTPRRPAAGAAGRVRRCGRHRQSGRGCPLQQVSLPHLDPLWPMSPAPCARRRPPERADAGQSGPRPRPGYEGLACVFREITRAVARFQCRLQHRNPLVSDRMLVDGEPVLWVHEIEGDRLDNNPFIDFNEGRRSSGIIQGCTCAPDAVCPAAAGGAAACPAAFRRAPAAAHRYRRVPWTRHTTGTRCCASVPRS